MRINQFIARATGMSRRAADSVITAGRITVNGQPAELGTTVSETDTVNLDGKLLQTKKPVVLMLNKPVGFVCSREGQGSRTIYELLPEQYRNLKPVGRLDKDSSGLLLLTNDGNLANKLTHPSFAKVKVYEVSLNKPLTTEDASKIIKGIQLEDGLSELQLKGAGGDWTVTMQEGRNRQVRRTFASLGYSVTKLHRTEFGLYKLDGLDIAKFKEIS